MKFVFAFLISVFSISVNANASDAVKFSPEFSQIMEVYNNMTPQQRAEVMETAKKIQKELEQKSPAEQEEYWQQAREAMKQINFENVDPTKLNTSKSLNLDDIDGYLNSQRLAR